MAMTRREFLKRTGVATAGTMVLPGLFGNPWVRKALADTIGDRYLVILFLDGGNDGLNTVIPIDDTAGLLTAYNAARKTGGGGLRITPGQASIPAIAAMDDPISGTALGFHPGLAGITSMYDAGNVAVIQGTGYPSYSLSHAEASNIWRTANPTGNALIAGSGWAGRHLGLEYGPSDIYAVTIGDAVAGELVTGGTSVLAVEKLSRFGFPFDGFEEGDHAIFAESFQDVYGQAASSAEPLTSLLGNAGQATYTSTQNYPPLHGLYTTDRLGFSNAYAAQKTSLARDLREVAKMIYGTSTAQPGVNARFFQCRNGGYDTHADQGGANGRHYDLHAEVANAVELFFQDMDDMGVGNKVTLVVWSEFSRRIPQNSNGTDHGSQGPMFVIGGAVNGGVYGNHPNIGGAALDPQENTVYSQAGADPFRSTDFRDVFGTILKQWVNMSEVQILADVLPLDTVGSPDEYWHAQNFDMGFL